MNIYRIKQEINPKYLRIVYMLTNENEHEVNAFFDCMIARGMRDVMISIPEHIEKGRTYKLHDGCNMSDYSSEYRALLDKKTFEIGKLYEGKINTIADRLGSRGFKIANAIPSCGAGWTMLSFQSNGNVLPCNMMGNEWILGNYKKDSSLSFLSFKSPMYTFFSNINLTAEDGNRKECACCSYNDFCGKCINKIFIANRKRINNGEDLCPILKKNKFPNNKFLK